MSIESNEQSKSTLAFEEKNILNNLTEYFPFSIFATPKAKIAVISLEGIIGKGAISKNGLSLKNVNSKIEKAFKIKNLYAVSLIINSPGGSPTQSELIAKRIMYHSSKYNVPVYAFIEDVAASGGYWLACAADKIYATKSSIIGSIGVISSGFGFVEAIKKHGIERRVITQGKSKSVLDPFMPSKDSDIKIIANIQKNIHENFIDFVKLRRKSHLLHKAEDLFSGEFWSGETAAEYGLIDGIDDIYSFYNRKLGDDNYKMEYIIDKPSFFDRFYNMFNVSYRIKNNKDQNSDFIEDITDKFSNSLINSLEQKSEYKKYDLK